MRIRIAVLSIAFFTPLFSQAPPPMFSPKYGEAMRDILQLEESDAGRLERQLAANPEDYAARLKLMAYHHRADRAGRADDRTRRLQLTLWLIERHPESEILHSPVARFTEAELSPAQKQRSLALWAAASKAKPRDAAIQWNAASFCEPLDPPLFLHYLETTAVADPNHPYALRPLAFLYAQSILQREPLAAASQAGLDASKNVWVVSNAAYWFQSQYNLSLQRQAPNPRASQLAQLYFQRAQAIDPKLDRRAILPELPPPSKAAPEKPGTFTLRQLPIDVFPDLPPAIASVLRARRCKVPQPVGAVTPYNAIRGEFFVKGEAAWAVLCTAGNATSLLVFHNNSDTRPETLVSGKQDYSRTISPVNRDFILRHYRAYGGPPPPPIDHAGIDDAFDDKASITWYFHNGKWLRLQGAD